LPVLVTATGMIKTLPTCTLPKLTLETESAIWADTALEAEKSEKSKKIQYAGLWGEPK
jgi:hypothetical protein